LLHHGRGDEETSVEVVGVVADARYRYISDTPEPFLFVPMAQHPVGDVTFFVRHAGGAAPTDAAIRSAVASVEPSLPVLFLMPFDDMAAIALTPQRVTAWIASAVGVAGVGLAALGLYGLMAFLVTQRTREIAIRMALGASAAEVRRSTLGAAARLGAIGAAIGLGLAFGVGRVLRALLVGVEVVDPVSWAAAIALAMAVLAAASWGPARRAATTDPAQALRAE
jgi:hypothetical protein